MTDSFDLSSDLKIQIRKFVHTTYMRPTHLIVYYFFRILFHYLYVRVFFSSLSLSLSHSKFKTDVRKRIYLKFLTDSSCDLGQIFKNSNSKKSPQKKHTHSPQNVLHSIYVYHDEIYMSASFANLEIY